MALKEVHSHIHHDHSCGHQHKPIHEHIHHDHSACNHDHDHHHESHQHSHSSTPSRSYASVSTSSGCSGGSCSHNHGTLNGMLAVHVCNGACGCSRVSQSGTTTHGGSESGSSSGSGGGGPGGGGQGVAGSTSASGGYSTSTSTSSSKSETVDHETEILESMHEEGEELVITKTKVTTHIDGTVIRNQKQERRQKDASIKGPNVDLQASISPIRTAATSAPYGQVIGPSRPLLSALDILLRSQPYNPLIGRIGNAATLLTSLQR